MERPSNYDLKEMIMKYLLFALLLQQCAMNKAIIYGTWQNESDPNTIVEIDRLEYREVSENNETQSYKYELSLYSCDKSYYNGNERNLTFLKLDDGRCYEVTGLTDSTLALRYVTSGRLLIFKRR